MRAAREVATHVVRALRERGHEAYFAGGCVRDELLGLEPDDYDVATSATPDRVREAFPRASEVGASFGVLLVSIPSIARGVVVEVATFREEGAYSDRRRPDEVRFSTAQNDARRRDFTVNALFLDPLEGDAGRVIDFVGGVEDLRRRVLRAVGDPDDRLAEDHLRALRGVRLSSRLGFAIEKGTWDAIRRHAAELRGVSRERVGEELRRMLAHPSRASAAREMQALGLDASALEEPGVLAEPVALGALPGDAPFTTALAAWAVDRLAASGTPTPEGLGRAAPGLAQRWRRSLCLSNDETHALASTLEGVAGLAEGWATMSVARRKRAAASAWFGPAALILTSQRPALADEIRADVTRLEASPGGVAPTPLVNGDDLVALGLRPGPAFKGWLDRLYDEQLEGRLRTREESLAAARKLSGMAG